MNNKTPKNLIAVAAVAIMLLGANNASAYVPGVWDPQPRVNNKTNESAFVLLAGSAFYDATPTQAGPVVYQQNPQQTQNTNTQTQYTNQNTNQVQSTNNTANRVPTNNTNTNTNTRTYVAPNTGYNNNPNNLPPVVQSSNGMVDQGNGLTALSVQGNGGFLPSSIWQWILVIFLILIAIIIFRSMKADPHHAPAHH